MPVPIDLQGVAEEAFFATVAEAVGETIGDEHMSAARAVDGYDSRELVRDLRRVLPTIECADDKLAKLVLLFDEIDELNGYSHRTNQRLRSLFMRGFADQLVAVAAGVGIARQWDHEGSPWYNFFEELEVGPIETAAARRLVTEPLGGVIAVDRRCGGSIARGGQRSAVCSSEARAGRRTAGARGGPESDHPRRCGSVGKVVLSQYLSF